MSFEDARRILCDAGLFVGAASAASIEGSSIKASFTKSRHKSVALARHRVWFFLRARGWSFPEIAKLYGVDHTTVMSGVNRVRKLTPIPDSAVCIKCPTCKGEGKVVIDLGDLE